MRRRPWIAFAPVWLAAVGAAQEPSGERELEVRVVSARLGEGATIDRGARDLLRAGDPVVFHPRAGGLVRGVVRDVFERTAFVEVREPGLELPPGTRGIVRLPAGRARRAAKTPKEPTEPTGRERTTPQPAPQDPPAWRPGMPLLGPGRPLRPRERRPRLRGRAYVRADLSHAPPLGFDDSLVAAGAELRVENPFGNGGELGVDAQVDWKTEQNEQSGADLLIRELGYAWGGTRFAPHRWQVGRFLQHGLPELGFLDGVEWGMRTERGHRFGLSLGFLPEPDDDFESFEDLQLAGHATWVLDPDERLVLTTGFQKTLHHGKTDRDLLLARGRWLTEDGWDLHAALWFDFYYGRDDAKRSFVELTQAIVGAVRRDEDGRVLDLSYRHFAYPQLLRDEFLPVDPIQLRADRHDRLAASGRTPLAVGRWLHGYAAVWNDEDHTGGALEAGVEFEDALVAGGRLDLVLLGTLAEREKLVGARVAFGQALARGRWDLLYEIADHRWNGFPDDADDVLQHRLRASVSLWLAGDLDVSAYAEARVWDDEFSWGGGFYLEKRF